MAYRKPAFFNISPSKTALRQSETQYSLAYNNIEDKGYDISLTYGIQMA
jgi:hypothetical protein